MYQDKLSSPAEFHNLAHLVIKAYIEKTFRRQTRNMGWRGGIYGLYSASSRCKTNAASLWRDRSRDKYWHLFPADEHGPASAVGAIRVGMLVTFNWIAFVVFPTQEKQKPHIQGLQNCWNLTDCKYFNEDIRWRDQCIFVRYLYSSEHLHISTVSKMKSLIDAMF